MSRPIITALSFPVLLLLYFLYGWVIVPFVLPERIIESATTSTNNPASIVDDLTPFLPLFNENNWELSSQTRPKILRNGNTIIVFQKEVIEGDTVKLQPCTFIVLPEDDNLSQEEQCRRSIVLRTDEMAEIKFDDAVNFSKLPLPNMVGGRLLGKVTITSGMKETGTQDDLFIETSDIAIVETPAETSIYAIKDNVKFKLGLNSGEGSRMVIALKRNEKNNQKKSPKEFAVLRLEFLKFLNLIFPEKSNKNKSDSGIAAQSANDLSETNKYESNQSNQSNQYESNQSVADSVNDKITTLYVPNQTSNDINSINNLNQNTIKPDTGAVTKFDITCQREFTFEVDNINGGWTAGFNGNVDVIRTNSDSSQDFLNGELLHINFQSESAANQDNTSRENFSLFDSGNLQPAKMEVFGKQGTPANLRSTQGGGLVMEGDRILYDVKKNIIAVETALTDNPQEAAGATPENPKKKPEASDSVRITLQNRYTVQSELGFLYNIGKSGEFGILNSSGKGKLDGLIGNSNDTNLKKIHLTWNVLQISSEPNNTKRILFDLRGGVTVDVEDFGKMSAEILQLWCNIEEKPKSPESNNSQNNVTKNNPQNAINGKSNSNSTLVPESAIVLNKVHFENQNGTCDVQRLNIFFTRSITGNNVTNIMQSSTAVIQPSSFAVTPTVTSELQKENNRKDISPIKQVQYTQLRKNPEQFMPSMPPAIELIKPNGINVAQNNTTGSGNYMTAGSVNSANSANTNLNINANSNTNSNANIDVNTNIPNVPQPEIKNVRFQNLLGFQPGNPNSIFAITGDQMEMSVWQDEHTSQVQRLWIGGNVRIVEKVDQSAGNDLIEITGEEVYVWYPSTPKTVIYITGKNMREAIFTGKGTQIRAMNVYIFRAENVIKIVGAGRLIANVKSNKSAGGFLLNANSQPNVNSVTQFNNNNNNNNNINNNNNQFEQNKRSENDSRILVQWNSEMYFDGNVISFKGVPDKNGNRVLALMEDREIHCNVMQIFTNRYVSLFDDKSDVTIKPERIGCAIDVVMKSEKFENGLRKSFDWAEFEAVEFRLETDEFFAKGPGFIRSTFLETDNIFSDPKNGHDILSGIGSSNVRNVNNRDSIFFLCIWFYDHIQGVFAKTHKSAIMRGHIDAVLCPISAWDERIEKDQLNIATKKGYLLKCEELRMVQIPDTVNQLKNFVELTAIDNATIEGENRSLYGRAQTIKFNQAKGQVMLEGNELNNARVTTSSQGTIPAQRIEYNIKNGTAKIVNSRGVSAGNSQ